MGAARAQTGPMSVTALLLLLSAALYAGFQWTIRLLVYPQFAGVDAADFGEYEAAHQRRVSLVVGPLFGSLVLATAAIAVHPPRGTSYWWVAAAIVLLMVILGVTATLAVPLHTRLSHGFDAAVHRRLLRVDSIRLAAAILNVGVAVVLIVPVT